MTIFYKKYGVKWKIWCELFHHCTVAWVTRPERPKGAKDEVKQAQRAKSRPEVIFIYIYQIAQFLDLSISLGFTSKNTNNKKKYKKFRGPGLWAPTSSWRPECLKDTKDEVNAIAQQPMAV